MKKLDIKDMQFEIDSSKTKNKIKGWGYMYKKLETSYKHQNILYRVDVKGKIITRDERKH